MHRTVGFGGQALRVLTLVYAFVDGKVLMLERGPHKAFLAGWMVAPGGKVEAGEDIVDSGVREFYEETGMRLLNPRLRGSYTFVTDTPSNPCGVIYLICGDMVEGDFKPEVEDGTLRWMSEAEILASDKVMDDHKVWMKELFAGTAHVACVGLWKAPASGQGPNELVEWADSRAYFEGRN